MAELNFPDPTASPTYEQAGIVWTWSETLEAWISDGNDGFTETDGDGRYLRKDATAGPQTEETTNKTTFKGDVDLEQNVAVTGNQSVTGTLGVTGVSNFTGLTTHSGGIGVTGGSLDSTAVKHNAGANLYKASINVFNYYSSIGSSTVHSRITLDGTKSALTGASKKVSFTFISQPSLLQSSTLTNFCGFSSVLLNTSDSIDYTGLAQGYLAGDSLANKTLGDARGFSSYLNKDGSRNIFNIYAEGSAPSYFKGGIQFDQTHSQGGTQDQLLLDAYEEGTFTAASTNSALDPFTKDGLSYYQIVGKTVTYAIRIGLNADGPQTVTAGTYNITGFPFSNVAANSGGVVTFIGTSNSFKSEANAAFISNGPTLRFVVDSNINNVTLIRCTFPVFLT